MVNRLRSVGSTLVLFAAFVLNFVLPGGFVGAEETFPSKPIEVVIHSKYGGGTDTTARLMMIRARRVLGVDMSVVAKRGGSGAKAHHYAKCMDRPCVARTKSGWISGPAQMYSASMWSFVAPGHHGYQRAFGLISR